MPDGPLHKNQTGANLHVPGYQQSSDPGAVGAGKYWIDTTGGTGAWALKVRNAGDSGWETVATAGTGLTAATQAEQEAATSTTVGVTPGRQQFHPSACKAWAYVTISGGTPTLQTSYNITSITDTATGQLTVTIATDFSSANWAHSHSVGNSTGAINTIYSGSKSAGSIILYSETYGVNYVDPESTNFAAWGDQ